MAVTNYTRPSVISSTYSDTGYGQKQKPIDRSVELIYQRSVREFTHFSGWGVDAAKQPSANSNYHSSTLGEVHNAVLIDVVSSSQSNWQKQIYNKAYDKFLGKSGDAASLLTAVAERQSTYAMVLTRLSQFFKAANALRKGRFGDFLKILQIQAKNKHAKMRRSRPKDFSGLWLEYWFGWAPTIGDISTAIDVWQGEIPNQRVKAASGAKSLNLPFNTYTSSNKTWRTGSVTGTYFLQLRATIAVENYDLFLANKLGFVNPVATAWELIPFSWFFDYFTNVGQVLGSFTDMLGLSIKDVWLTRFARVSETYKQFSAQGGIDFSRRCSFVKREPLKSIPRPSFIYRLPKISWTRAATLSSLIVQLFLPQKRA